MLDLLQILSKCLCMGKPRKTGNHCAYYITFTNQAQLNVFDCPVIFPSSTLKKWGCVHSHYYVCSYTTDIGIFFTRQFTNKIPTSHNYIIVYLFCPMFSSLKKMYNKPSRKEGILLGDPTNSKQMGKNKSP
ncbi:hypothetical protein D3C77_499170 [compost metagenome]